MESTTLSAAVARPVSGPVRQAPRLGEILVRAGVVDEAIIAELLREQRTKGAGRLGMLLIERRVCTHEQIRGALREQMNIDVVDLEQVSSPHPEVLDLLPLDLVQRYEVIPLSLDGDRLRVAMLDPYNLTAIDDIRFITGIQRIQVVACVETDFRKYIRDHLQAKSLIDEVMEGEEFFQKALDYVGGSAAADALTELEEVEEATHEIQPAGGQSPIITLCDFILVEAIRQRASNIHIEPYETYFLVRLRVDGTLRLLMTPPKRLEVPTVARFKAISQLDVTERGIAQDGHLVMAYSDTKFHFRVSTLPTAHGEKVMLRVLKRDPQLKSLEDLGFGAPELALVQRALALPQGLILVTGPTGAGKTTTVHAALRQINTGDTNIVTLEDPVEITIPGINHVPIKAHGGVTFKSGLRSILRQDPDVVFVGEMRDPEVTSIALRASLTGHLVLSTLHANNAIESIARLDDLGTPPYLVAGSLQLIVAQQLVRRICWNCAAEYDPTDEELRAYGIDSTQAGWVTFFKGEGCSRCSETGYFGRIAAFEVLKVDREIRRLIRRRSTPKEIFDAARDSGMRTLSEAALEHVVNGETSLEEFGRVSYTVD